MILQMSRYPSAYHLDRIATFLRDDGVIAIPTDTTYSLACLPDRKNAVKKLRMLRRLDPKKSLALLFRDIGHVGEYAWLDDGSFRLLKRYLPGPYCFILEVRRGLPKNIGDKRKRIGVRIPDHGVPQAIIDVVDSPLIVTSAIDPETDMMAADPWTVEAVFGHGLSAVIDTGDIAAGESSIIDLTVDPPEVHRTGLGATDEFET